MISYMKLALFDCNHDPASNNVPLKYIILEYYFLVILYSAPSTILLSAVDLSGSSGPNNDNT